ncbi:MAG TPA: FliM/FliN family flagellar motor switch protein [Candidatus Eremiobacteraceae bacterium]|nr:FliM/FliN family flagellar motor switch protein [Candidatus Eremiobacteraceae bacterium]
MARAAAAIEAQAPKALKGRGSVVGQTPAQRSLTAEEIESAHVWHSDDGDGLDLWCILGLGGARTLLGIVLHGPAGDEPTPLERNIVRETVERLLAATGRVWEEQAASRLPVLPGWCCRLDLTDALGAKSTFTLIAPQRCAPTRKVERVDLRAIPVKLDASLPATQMRVDAIACWSKGDVITLACAPDVQASLRAGVAYVAAGSLGASRGKRAILVTRSA